MATSDEESDESESNSRANQIRHEGEGIVVLAKQRVVPRFQHEEVGV